MPRSTNKQKKLHVRKGDQVALTKAITAYKDELAREKGYAGRVLAVYPSKQRVIVEGVNIRVRHTKPNKTHPQGGRIEREMPIHASNVMPLDGDGRPTRIGRKLVTDTGTGRGRWVRVAVTTGLEIDR